MPISINVIDIINNEYQLESLPVGENLKIRLTQQVDLKDIGNHIALVRVESAQSTPNLGDIYVHRLHDSTDYSVVDISFTQEQVSGGYLLTVNPEDFLLPNSNYYLVIGKTLAPLYYTITKPVSSGPSTISVQTSIEVVVPVDKSYSIQFNQTSSLANNKHKISFTVTSGVDVNTYTFPDIKQDNVLKLSDTISVLFNPNIPYLAGETFNLNTLSFTRLGTTRIQKISTFIDSDVIENVQETSTRINQQSILDFYSNTNWSNQGVVSTPTEIKPINARFVHPNKIVLEFDREIEYSSITLEAFNVSLTYAFDNYMLVQMGLFDENKKYVVLINPQANNPKRINLIVLEDLDNTVPENYRFILALLEEGDEIVLPILTTTDLFSIDVLDSEGILFQVT